MYGAVRKTRPGAEVRAHRDIRLRSISKAAASTEKEIF